MIEVENNVLTLVKEYLTEKLGEEFEISSDTTYIPAKFPHISIVEGDSINYQSTIDTHSNENHVQSMIDVNVWTNDSNGRKSRAKEIANYIDEIMLFKGFNRISKQQVPDETYYRLNIRYQGIVDNNFNVYRR